MPRHALTSILIPVLMLGAACTSNSSRFTPTLAKAAAASIQVCHGFDCRHKTELAFAADDEQRLSDIMAGSAASAAAERQAVSSAVQFYEQRYSALIGVADGPKSTLDQTGQVGQMDCIDESTNTRSLLLYLQARGLLKHHTVERNVSRGFFLDARYPHSTAVLSEKGRAKWAVDSWYEPAGGAPDIRPLSEWLSRGVGGAR